MKPIQSILAFLLLVSAVVLPHAHAAENRKPVQVFILAGQSNMEGKAKVSLLEYQIAQPETRPLFEHLQKNGAWVEPNDVWIKFLNRHGKLTIGYGSPKCIGPELEEWNKVGSDYPYHYLGSAKTMCRIGRAFGEAILELRDGARPGKPSP